MELVIGTSSPHKLAEIVAILADLPLDLLTPDDVGGIPDVAETGATFAENARLKALAIARHTDRPAMADDSGLEVDALHGDPGVRSRRFAGPGATDADRNRRLLGLLADVPRDQRGAQYQCAIALAVDGDVVIETTGIVRGRIAERPAGRSGFGYDPLFIPDEHDQTVAELGDVVKNRLSHRARALAALKPRLADYLRTPE